MGLFATNSNTLPKELAVCQTNPPDRILPHFVRSKNSFLASSPTIPDIVAVQIFMVPKIESAIQYNGVGPSIFDSVLHQVYPTFNVKTGPGWIQQRHLTTFT